MHARVNEFNGNGGYAGYSDWRVPIIDELETLIVEGQVPSIDTQAFSMGSGYWFWSSSGSVEEKEAWHVDFGKGYVKTHIPFDSQFVRLVRGG